MTATQTANVCNDVVMLHPAGTDGRIWWKVAQQLESDVSVHCPALIGSHNSGEAAHGFPALADELAEWVSKQGLKHFVLVGISMGGMVAQYYAARFPHQIVGLVIGNTNYVQDTAKNKALLDRAKRSRACLPQYVEETLPRWFDEDFVQENPDDLNRVKEILLSIPAAAHSTAWNLISTLDTRDFLQEIASPTFVIGSSKDRSTPLRVQEEIRDRLPNACLLTNDAAHMSCVERPDTWVHAVRTLLGQGNPAFPATEKVVTP